MRQRLSGADAFALHTETSTAPSHLLVMITLDGDGHLSHAGLHKLAGSSLPGLAKFRCRLVNKPFGLGQPVWAEADFDPAAHLHRIAVAPPGGRGEFADLVAKLVTRPLNRDIPLWEAWTIEGLEGDRWVLALKLSPLLVGRHDGVSAILERLLTAAPDDDPTNLPVEDGPGAWPSVVDLVTDTAAEFAANQIAGMRLAGEALPDVLRVTSHRLRGDADDSEPVPRTVFNEPLTKRREVAFGSFPVADVAAVKDAFDVVADDVFLAACTLSLRGWFQRRGALPDHPLVIQMPMAAHSGRVRLPVHLDDPAEVLDEVHTQTQRILVAHRSNSETASTAMSLPAFAQLLPPTVVHTGMRLYTGLELSRRLAPNVHGIAANITGSPVGMYCGGARVAGVHVVPALQEGAGLALTMTSHDQVVGVSVSVCPERVGGVEEIADGIVEAVAQIRERRET